MPKQDIIAIYIPAELLEIAEETRRKLGMNRSRFFQYCLTRVLQDLSVLTSKVHDTESG